MAAYYNKNSYGAGHYSAGFVYGVSGGFSVRPVFGGTLANPVTVSGAIPVVVGFGSPRLSVVAAAKGGLAVPVAVGVARLNSALVASGGLTAAVRLAASAGAGPLWTPATPCQAQWAPEELCDG